MSEEYNIYCDESCHLEHDGINDMGIGCIWMKKNRTTEINSRIREIKKRNGTPPNAEIKWTKVSPAKHQLYIDLINYFFDDDDLHYRVLIVPDKKILDHNRYNQTHDEFYYKMYFDMLKAIFDPMSKYNIYTDIKDTHSANRILLLHDILCNNQYDFSHNIIKKVQPINSKDVQAMQITDVLTGAVTYANRVWENNSHSKTKMELIELIKKRSKYTLRKTTLLNEKKFNMLMWCADYGM